MSRKHVKSHLSPHQFLKYNSVLKSIIHKNSVNFLKNFQFRLHFTQNTWKKQVYHKPYQSWNCSTSKRPTVQFLDRSNTVQINNIPVLETLRPTSIINMKNVKYSWQRMQCHSASQLRSFHITPMFSSYLAIPGVSGSQVLLAFLWFSSTLLSFCYFSD